MLKKRSICIGYVLFLFIIIIPGRLRAQQITSSAEIKQTIEQSRADDAFWSVIVRNSKGKILEQLNADKLVHPASNLKLLTSAMILDELGPNFTYSTRIYGMGRLVDSTWQGNIIVRGSGDPSISGTFYDDNRFYVFNKFYHALDSLGIQHVEGALIGNNSYFDQKPYPDGWNWDDLSFYYAVEINALSFNENAVDLRVYARNSIGEKPDIEWFPFDTDYVEFINEQVITPPYSEYDEFYRRIMGTNTILLRSSLPKNYVEKESLSILDGAQYFMDTFKKYLAQSGISVTSIFVENQSRDWNNSSYRVLAEHRSVPLSKMLVQVNKESNNFYTEMLLKTAAAERYNTTGSTALGLSLVEDFASEMGINTEDLELSDGSGLASSTLLSIEDLSAMLVKMRSHPYFEEYKNSLAVAGRSGTLEYRFRNTAIAGKLFGKTGYISGVRALSGYLEAKSGQPLIVSVITNNYTEPTSYIDNLHEEIIQNVYQKY